MRLASAVVLCLGLVYGQSPATGVIEGDVVDAATGAGIRGARVRAQSGSDEPTFATSDEKGHFRMAGLTPKSYRVDARFPGFMSSKEANGRGVEQVDVWRGARSATVRLEMQRYAAIVGKVTDAWGVPVEGAWVDALERYPIAERHFSSTSRYNEGAYQYIGQHLTYTDDLGEYRISPLPAGSYYVYVQPIAMVARPVMRPPRDDRERSTFYPHALKPSEGKPLEVVEGKELHADIQVVREGGVKVSGRILGPALEGMTLSVALWPLSPGASRSLATVTGDRYEARDLLPGKYVVEGGAYPANESLLQTRLAAARRTIEVGAQDVGAVDLTLAPTQDLEGTVVFEEVCAVVPLSIFLQSDSQLGGVPQRQLQPGPDGRFVVKNLPPAKNILIVRPEVRADIRVRSVKLGGAEVPADGFETTAETRGPLRIVVGCGGGR